MTFDEFLSTFLGALSSADFSNAGALDEYLLSAAESRTGDEADVVDFRVTSRLLAALDYAPNEITYNKQKQNLRPDFVIRIPEYPTRACFVVEDKSTATTLLASHRPQLHLVHQLNQKLEGTTLDSAEHEGLRIPATPAKAVKAFQTIDTGRAKINDLLQIISSAKSDISNALGALFQPLEHPAILDAAD